MSTPAVRLLDIRDEALSLDEVYSAVTDPAAGGICIFIGTVRDHDSGEPVTALGYSSHPTDLEGLRVVAERIADETDVMALAAVHRMEVCDLAEVVAASAAHRAEAFDACRRLIDELKTDVAVWKHQTFESGDSAWV